MNKEEVYDTFISPLMTQIIAICKEHKIATVAQFAIPTPDDNSLCCTTVLTTKEFNAPDYMKRAVSILKNGGPPPLNLRTESADGTTTLTTILS